MDKPLAYVLALVSGVAYQDEWMRLVDASEGLSPIEKIALPAIDWACANEGFAYESQFKIGKYTADFFIHNFDKSIKIIIECDGHEFHEKTKEQAQHDKKRDRFLQEQGYRVYRFTGSEIYKTSGRVVAESISKGSVDLWDTYGIPSD